MGVVPVGVRIAGQLPRDRAGAAVDSLGDRSARESQFHERLDLVSFALGQVASGHEQLHLPVKELRLRHLAHFADVALRFEVESALNGRGDRI